MKLHILGICGTFMGSLAQLAKQQGDRVTGSDQQVYPPMSDQLRAADIELIEGYDPALIPDDTDLIVIGNALSRGNPSVEAVLNTDIAYCSGPQWLATHCLSEKTVIAVAGTHGKTTTSSMLAWILECAGLQPGFLIGGVPKNFDVSARLTDSPYFVIEADEYDTAFFDKRSKFVHYHPNIQILNNLEYDHADIFDSIEDIKTQFHHLLRIIPGNGHVIYNHSDPHIADVLNMGCWSEKHSFASQHSDWKALFVNDQATQIQITTPDGEDFQSSWELQGQHNLHNACAAIAAASCIGVSVNTALSALASFSGIKRRMECLYQSEALTVFEDFAHHPTAIQTTIDGVRRRWPDKKLIIALEPRSCSMRSGAHAQALAPSMQAADQVLVLAKPELKWDATKQLNKLGNRLKVYPSVTNMVDDLAGHKNTDSIIVLMSNGSFDGLPRLLSKALSNDKGNINE